MELWSGVKPARSKQKDAVRVILPDRTGGWQLGIDPVSHAVLGACAHPVNDRTTDKVELRQAVLSMPNLSGGLGDSRRCKNQTEAFEGVKFYA